MLLVTPDFLTLLIYKYQVVCYKACTLYGDESYILIKWNFFRTTVP